MPKTYDAGNGRRVTVPESSQGCEACGSYEATTERLGASVCPGCAHMIDAHGAKLADAHAADPCQP